MTQTTSYLTIANSFGMWVSCSFIILVVVFQAAIFMNKAYQTGLDMGLSKAQLIAAMRSGAICTIGPAIAIVVAMVSLIVSLGAPFAWMRLSVIGSVPFELMAAEAGAVAVGTTLGGVGYDLKAFANSVWTCTLGASGWIIVCAVFTDKFDYLRKRAVRGREELIPVLSVGAMIGAFAYFGAPYLAGRGLPSTVSYLVGALVMVGLNILADKSKLNWLKEWTLGIAMVCGMFAALLFI